MALPCLPGRLARAAGGSLRGHHHHQLVAQYPGMHAMRVVGKSQTRQQSAGLGSTSFSPSSKVPYHALGSARRGAKQLVAATAEEGVAAAHEAVKVLQEPSAPALTHAGYYAGRTYYDLAPQDMQFYHLSKGPLVVKPRHEHQGSNLSLSLNGEALPFGVLWLSCRSEWTRSVWDEGDIEVTEAELGHKTHLYRVDLDLTHMFILDNDADLKRLDSFISQTYFPNPEVFDDDEVFLDWDKMSAAGYKGFLVTKGTVEYYGTDRRPKGGQHSWWISNFKACGAAIWDTSAIRGEPELVASGEALEAMHDTMYDNDWIFTYNYWGYDSSDDSSEDEEGEEANESQDEKEEGAAAPVAATETQGTSGQA